MEPTRETSFYHDILRDWYTQVWENGNLDVIENFYNDDVSGISHRFPPEHSMKASEVREWVIVLRSFVTDIRVKFLQFLEQGDWCNLVIEIKCKPIGSDQQVSALQLITLRFENGKVAEVYRSFDWIRFFEQLGQLPTDTHALLLSGTVLR